MFDAMVEEIRSETVRTLLRVEIRKAPVERVQLAKPLDTGGDGSGTRSPARSGQKVGRNQPCPCGSGKKYKNCCGKGA